jgi:hypothetical protein
MMDHRLDRREPTETPVRLHFSGGTRARGLGSQHRSRRYVRGVGRLARPDRTRGRTYEGQRPVARSYGIVPLFAGAYDR